MKAALDNYTKVMNQMGHPIQTPSHLLEALKYYGMLEDQGVLTKLSLDDFKFVMGTFFNKVLSQRLPKKIDPPTKNDKGKNLIIHSFL